MLDLRDAPRARLLDGNTRSVRPWSARLPIPYHMVPGELRVRVARSLAHRGAGAATELMGHGYADNGTDLLVRALSGKGPPWCWPGGRRAALVITHDTDGSRQSAGLARLADISARRGLRATFTVVGRFLTAYRNDLFMLRGAGHEIALHDIRHDNRIAFLPHDAIVKRLAPLAEALAEYRIRGFRSPSWYTSPTLWAALSELGFGYDMSVLDTWTLFGRGRAFGVGSVFPFLIDDLVVLPSTLPLEVASLLGRGPRMMLDYWRTKIDWIVANGGLLLINVHADRWWSGNPVAARAYEDCLDYALGAHDLAVMTAGELERHVRAEVARGAFIDLGGKPRVRAPRASAA